MVTLGDLFGGISPHLMLQRLNSQAGRSTVFVSEAVKGLKKSGFGEALSHSLFPVRFQRERAAEAFQRNGGDMVSAGLNVSAIVVKVIADHRERVSSELIRPGLERGSSPAERHTPFLVQILAAQPANIFIRLDGKADDPVYQPHMLLGKGLLF